MQDFGSWVRKKRTERGYNLTSAALYAGVDASTISRIENGRTQATLQTAIRLCEGFGIKFKDLISDLVGADVIDSLKNRSREGIEPINVLTLEDVTRFLEFTRQDSVAAFELLAAGVTIATDIERTGYEEKLSPPFDVNHMIRLVIGEPVIYKAELKYPPFYDIDVLQTYISGGVLTYFDVGVYLRSKREESDQTLASIESRTEQSASSLSRIESGAIGKIKLRTVLELSQEFGGKRNDLLGMFWEASQYQSVVSGKIKITGDLVVTANQIADILVKIARWLQPQTNWLDDLRTQMS